MPRRRAKASKSKSKAKAKANLPKELQAESKIGPGLLVTQELETAIEECRTKVRRISKQCREKNTRFRDLEFDLEHDRDICLHRIFPDEDETYDPSDIDRVTKLFDDPQFFKDGGADSSDVSQGSLGDCWFISALATVSTFSGLIEKICVERDESIGVYGFIFFKDNAWKSVIIDDLVYTKVPKYEELNSAEQALYHNDKDAYNKNARKNGKSLYFAQSATIGETWVPLIEKAYAKLHGSFGSLSGGFTCEAVEDLTGGIATTFKTKDIWDIDRFWHEELGLANQDRLFGCAFNALDTTRNGQWSTEVQGLYGGHAYSVLRAVECNGKRFVICRNPWGQSEWTGRWSDGSKEWSREWLNLLPEIGHTFGDDGQFVMEYSDWLDTFTIIDRTLILNSSWRMSSDFLLVTTASAPSPWSYGDVSFTFTLPTASQTIVALSELDRRYFADLASASQWSFSFALVKHGDPEPLSESGVSAFYSRSVNVEVYLEPGTYYVYVRLDRKINVWQSSVSTIDTYEARKLSRVLAQRATSQSIASNFEIEKHKKFIPVSLQNLIENDLKPKEELVPDAAKGDTSAMDVDKVEGEGEDEGEGKGEGEKNDDSKAEEGEAEENDESDKEKDSDESQATDSDSEEKVGKDKATQVDGPGQTKKRATSTSTQTDESDSKDGDDIDKDKDKSDTSGSNSTADSDSSDEDSDDEDSGPKLDLPRDGPNVVCLGLRVYTHKDVVVTVVGRLNKTAAAAAAAPELATK